MYSRSDALPVALRPRRDRSWAIALVAAQIVLLVTGLSIARGGERPLAERVVRIGVTVEKMDLSIEFYTRVLDFQKISEREVAGPEFERLTGVFGARARIVRLRLGDEELELTEYLAPRGREVPRDSRSNDRWFQHVAIIVSDMDAAYHRLRQHRVRHASTGPQRLPDWNPNAGGIRAFYFHDPDGHVLEVLQFPADKGDPRWHEIARVHPNRVFLGIDHTAIVVGDTDKSVAFYRDVLGMKVAGTSENWGEEQERLNHVFGARLRITTLRAAVGPGVELLEYIAPRTGRPYPPDAAANDLFHWHTVVATGNAVQAMSELRERKQSVVSADVARALASNGHGFLARDVDGHAVQFIDSPPDSRAVSERPGR